MFSPQYITFRLRNDVLTDFPNAGIGKNEPIIVLNYLLFVADLLLITWVAAIVAWQRAAHAYCGSLGQWMERETTIWPAQRGKAFQVALETGRLAEFIATTPPGSGRKVCRLTLEYVVPATESPFRLPDLRYADGPSRIGPLV